MGKGLLEEIGVKELGEASPNALAELYRTIRI